jgi:Protein of unknown function (DUF5674)
MAERQFGDMVKAVVDVDCGVMAVGGELASDEEPALVDDGSRQPSLWASTSLRPSTARGGSNSTR